MATALDLLLEARHLPRQRRVLAALLDVAARSLWSSRGSHAGGLLSHLPGPELTDRVTSPAPALVRDYLRHFGAGMVPPRHPATVPPHLFPQWTFPVAARVLRQVRFPLTRLLNAGCRLEVNAPIPTSTPLTIRAQLLDVDDDGRRALLHQRVITATPAHPRAVVADLFTVAPRATRGEGSRAETSKGDHRPAAGVSDSRGRSDLVPPRSRELARFRFEPRAGLAFALLTGDANPVHWSAAYARAAGFATPILHGFAMMASAFEGLGRALFAGAADPLRVLDVRFKRPLVLGRGREVGLYHDDADEDAFYLADAPGVRAYVVGHFERRQEREHHA